MWCRLELGEEAVDAPADHMDHVADGERAGVVAAE
jgi:hypothetical protein